MENYKEKFIITIKKLERSQNSLKESVDKTIAALQTQIDSIKDEEGICYREECYETSAVHVESLGWICPAHEAEFKTGELTPNKVPDKV